MEDLLGGGQEHYSLSEVPDQPLSKWFGPISSSLSVLLDYPRPRPSRPITAITAQAISLTRTMSMSILRTATQPVEERQVCFLDNNDLGQLGCTSTSQYKVVSIALTMWAIWDPSVPEGGQMVGSPLVLDRFFTNNTSEYQALSITRVA